LAGVPTYFQSVSPVIGSYDWLDLTSGVGYRKYYAAASNTTGATTYFLATRIVDGPTLKWFSTITGGINAAVSIDIDFDVEMKIPAVVSGFAYTNFTYNHSAGGNAATRSIVNIYHVTSGGTETLLGTTTGVDRPAGAPKYYRECIKVSLTDKHFATGEKLRLNIQIIGDATAGDSTGLELYYDPASLKTYTDYDTRTIGSSITFDCPFKVNL
jgi:hypothetical protein